MSIDVSVVMPCWNVERWLPRCLDEVFAALPESAEVIAADDGSTDSTRVILEERAAREPRLKVLALPHGGVSAARNAALDVACGEWVFFVDPDDGVEPDFFTAMLEAVRGADADCCVTAMRERSEDGVFGEATSLKGGYRFATNAEIVAGYLPRIFGYSFDDIRAWYRGKGLFADREMASACRIVYRRALLEDNRIRFDPEVELFEDAMFNAEALLAARTMTCVARPLYRVTSRASGAMRTVPRDAVRYGRNKLALLAARNRLDAKAGGRLAPLYEGTCVLSALELLALRAKGNASQRKEFAEILDAYLADARVASALRAFPLSVRRPLVAAAVLYLRMRIRRRGM